MQISTRKMATAVPPPRELKSLILELELQQSNNSKQDAHLEISKMKPATADGTEV